MKTKRIILPVVAFTFMIFLISCSKVNETDSFDYVANAGKIHNQLVDNYYQNRSVISPNSEELISEIITLSTNFLVSEGYDQEIVLNTELLLIDKYKPSNLKSVLNNDFSIDMSCITEQLNDMGMYSDKFIIALEDVLNIVGSDVGIDTITNYVNTVFSLIEFDSEIDSDGQSLFVNIFNASNEYWTEGCNSNLKHIQLKRSSWVIINDGIGGVLGSIFGPVGSIVAGTAFSVATNEEIK